MNSISLRKSARRALFAVIGLALALVLVFSAGFRFNPTPSLPKGIYRLVSEAPTKSDLVSFCLEGEFAELALERGYLEPGSCPSGLRPLLKRLAGLPGDFVDPSAFPISSVDSQGRAMPSVLASGIIPSGVALVLADHPGSFDSRYVTTEKRFLVPTPLGEKVVSGLCGHFSFIEYEFTRNMEQSFDDIAEGKAEYRTVIASAYNQLSREVQAFAKATGKVCEKYGKPMVHRVKKPGKDGKGGYDFWGCSGWPECDGKS